MALRGFRVLEMAGLAPGPFCGMLLADFGATVVRVDRPQDAFAADCLGRGKRSIVLDLTKEGGVETFKRLSRKADVLLEIFRPGVMEKLGLGPQVLLGDNPSLVYARLSGFGQDGPWAKMAGHDINYVAMSGLLSILGKPKHGPAPPINLLADFGGGGLLCAYGILAALLERTRSGKGQVIDSSMTEGTAYMGSWISRTRLAPVEGDIIPLWTNEERAKNILDGGAHFYQTFETRDAKYMAVGALEPKFYSTFIKGLGLDPKEVPQLPFDNPEVLDVITKTFATKTQKEWTDIFKNTDACVTPVLPMAQTPDNEHNAARKSFLRDSAGIPFPAPSPRLSRTPANIETAKDPVKGEHTTQILTENGFSAQEIQELIKSRDVLQHVKSNI